MNQHSNQNPDFAAVLSDLWQRHLPVTRERLMTLERAVQQALAGSLDEALRAEAQSAAHKLSGNLGMFGYQEAGDVASEIEHIFKNPTSENVPHSTVLMHTLQRLLSAHL